MIWTCMCKAEIKMRPRERYYNRWKAKSRQTKAEMARPGERGYMARIYVERGSSDW